MKGIIGLVGIGAFVGSSALAADMPMLTKAPYNPPAAYNWTSCYFGINGAGATSKNDWAPAGGFQLGTTGPNGFFGGGQVGCDYQSGPLVVGVEAAFDWGHAKNSAVAQGTGANTLMDTTLKTFGTAEGRLGYAFNRVLPYVQGGLAGAQFSQQLDAATGTTITPTLGGNQNILGVAAGAGFEVAFLTNVSFKVEYNYIHLGTTGAALSCINPGTCGGTPAIPFDIKQNIQTVLFGLNYRFGLGSLAN